MGITQEFIHAGVPEDNAHIEAFHSILEAEVERAYEFDTLEDLKETMERYFSESPRLSWRLHYLRGWKQI